MPCLWIQQNQANIPIDGTAPTVPILATEVRRVSGAEPTEPASLVLVQWVVLSLPLAVVGLGVGPLDIGGDVGLVGGGLRRAEVALGF